MSKFRPDRRHPVNERERNAPSPGTEKTKKSYGRSTDPHRLAPGPIRPAFRNRRSGRTAHRRYGPMRSGPPPTRSRISSRRNPERERYSQKNEGTKRPKQKRGTGSGARKKYGPAYRPSPHFPSYSRIRRNRYAPRGESAVKLCSIRPRSEKFQISESCTPASRNAS